MAINKGAGAGAGTGTVGFSLEESNALVATLFASSMDGLAYITPDLKIRYANEQMARMLKTS
ncbi:MAG TPA: hypothetical protein DDW65_01535, partial [Firmicutes bacterium]|nr:hypothetical protein [Bacillota bacterium]